ncbi:DNA-binding HxlR family transcriptional regulator [Tardiphaga robiniae]|uniref:winged helix-turn-helix transcriptional regulator n=1 Tax=Tardiphaga robiniae TaxID=943830 RepID=UPI0028617E2C|nr:winged helix-turn-helix transcriptional regulator [Tardiphaga robiniae]MDR6660842.1 DNA-binding HxlR family transcriptional regulator [Tardiphaga robiniae]
MQFAECDEDIAANAETGGSALIDGVGEAVSMLIVRDALAGCRRPAEFQRRLGMPAEMIAAKLDALVETRILERNDSCNGIDPEYVLTDKGRELEPLLQALSNWGRAHMPIRNSILE